MTIAHAEIFPLRDNLASRSRRHREPAFEPPPWFAGSADRRLAGRAAEFWGRLQDAGYLPEIERFTRALAVEAVDDTNLIRLGLTAAGPSVEAVGSAVAATFTVAIGLLTGGRPFAAKLGAACAASLQTALPAEFEGGFARVAGMAPTLLTRGIVLPLAGPSGAIVAMVAVITWKEALSTMASDRLRRELARTRPFQPLTTRERHRVTWQ